MKRKMKISIGIGSILLLAFLITNCILVFKSDSKIARSYYITNYERVSLDQQRAYLEKEAIIVPKEEIRISADANALAQISVRPGQKIGMNEEIAAYKTEEKTQEQTKLQSEVNAYKRELSTLEGILSRLEAQDYKEPITSIDSEQIDDELAVIVETEMTQGTPLEAIATIEEKIAEVDRNINILNDQISELGISNVLSSPIDGVIGEVNDEAGTVTFVIYTDEKNLITYVSEKEWENVEENQFVELDQSILDDVEVFENIQGEDVNDSNSLENKEESLGIITEKQTIPATNTIWLKEMKKAVEMPKALSFEVRIDIDQPITKKPYASLTNTKIITNEAQNALRVDKDWVIKKEVTQDTETTKGTYIYSLDEDGNIQTTEVDVAFKEKGEAILTSSLENDQIVFSKQVKEQSTTAFFPMPFELPSKTTIKSLDWKHYLKYMIF
ncbi:MAG TPA: hypothetical protein VNS08_15285 [Ureibacillus sp.]|nr:hypothetical protein [Ureibacillus sp.]